ncbi:MAG: FAD-dependent oxidoreductase [Burkholderiales bacterium]
MSGTGPIVVIGGGHAGAQVCASLATQGQGARVHLVCEETELPYQRPPLSKTYLKNPDEQLQELRAASWFSDQKITVHSADAATAIDRARHVVRLRSGKELPYERVIIATGTRARQLPHLKENLANVAVLRTAADAQRLRALFNAAGTLTVIGGGFIGLEIAATAKLLGKDVTVLESAPRLLMRSLSPEVADHVLRTHRAAGIDVRLGVSVGHFEVAGDRVKAVTVDGVAVPVEALVLGIGAVPEHALASDAGLTCDNGIVVDEHMVTSDPAILAVGDCTNFPEPTSGRRMRLESIQNAADQARAAAATIAGTPQPYHALPWFWSDQGSIRLQMAGLMPADGTRHRRPGASDANFSVLHYLGDKLVSVESVNSPVDHMASRKLLEAGRSPAPADACDPAKPLKSFI